MNPLDAFNELRAAEAEGRNESVRQRLRAWDRLADHPIFAECFDSNLPLIDSMIARLDELHAATTDKENA